MSKAKKKGGIFLMVLGGWFLLFGTVLLLMGEIVTLRTGRMLDEGSKVMVEAGDLASVDPILDGKFVHAVARLSTDEILSDPAFGFSANAIALKRNVLYYQYVESTHKEVVGEDSDGDDITQTVYEYDKRWVDHPVKSSGFFSEKYKNFTLMQIDTTDTWAKQIRVGAYRLTSPLRKQLTERTGAPVDGIDPAVLAPWNEKAERALGVPGDWVSLDGTGIFIGADPGNPQIGDVRVSYDVILPQDVSLLACVSGDSLTFFRAGRSRIAYLKQGSHDAESMMLDQGNEKKETSAMGRVMGFLHAIFGFWLILKGLSKREGKAKWAVALTSGKLFWPALLIALGWTFAICSLPWLFSGQFLVLLFLAGGLGLVYLAYLITSAK